jgi:hypothetical protein
MQTVDTITVAELQEMSEKMYGAIVKADVDVAKRIVILDMTMHVDGEEYLLEHGSLQKDIWGINLHPDKFGTDEFVEFESMINLKPGQGNRSRGVDDEVTRKQIIDIINGVVHE